jgi:nuclear pore complex protein Nup205
MMPGDIFLFLSSNAPASVSQFHFRAWLLKILGLELHVTSLSGQRSQTQGLLQHLFVSAPSPMNQLNRRFEQPLTKMLDCLNSISIEGVSSLRDGSVARLINDPEISKCLVKDGYGQQHYDLRAVHAVLIQRGLSFVRQGALMSLQDRSRASEEAEAIMNELLELNQRMADMSARVHCALSWCQVVRISFGRCFDALPVNQREEMAYELLAAMFLKLSNPEEVSTDIVEGLSFAVLQVMSQMRKDRVYQSVLETSSVATSGISHESRGRLPVESLQQVLLKGILDAIIRPDTSLVQRGNFYATLLHYLIYTGPDEFEASDLMLHASAGSGDTSVSSTSASLAITSLLRGSGLNYVPGSANTYRTSLQVGNASVVKSYGDRLLEIICRDASDGTGAWPTVAFAVLTALYTMSSHEAPNRILSFMLKRNFLSDFVDSIRRDDIKLRDSLRYSDSCMGFLVSKDDF